MIEEIVNEYLINAFVYDICECLYDSFKHGLNNILRYTMEMERDQLCPMSSGPVM